MDKRAYLSSIYNKIFIGDIVSRYSITNTRALEIMMKKIAESTTKELSYTRLFNTVKSVGIPVGKSTIIQYIEYVKESFILYSINNYSAKLVEKESNPKYYFVDTGLLNLFLTNQETILLENLVANELVREYGIDNVYYYFDKVEVNFYLPESNQSIQVCYSLKDESMYQREVNAIVKLAKYKKCSRNIIVTYDEEKTIVIDDVEIEVIPAYQWMLKRSINNTLIKD